MPGATHTEALAAVRRQLRQVQVRWNGRALAQLLALLVAIGTTSAALVVALALAAGPRAFVAGAGAALAGAAVAGIAAARHAARHWLRAARAPERVDERAGLRGRLATLMEVDDAPGTAFFLPLLAAQNLRELRAWTPAAVVPRVVPRGAVAAALGASAALALLLASASRLAPPLSASPARGEPVSAVTAAPLGVPRHAAARVSTAAEWARERGTPEAGGAAAGERPTSLDRLADDLQARIRAGLWGERWRQAAEATARAERERRQAERDGAGDGALPDEAGWEAARPAARGAERHDRPRGPSAAAMAAAEAPPTGTGPRGGGARGARDGSGSGPRQAAQGAGTGTSPELYGAASEAAHTAGEPFELGIAARTRAAFAGSRRPSGDAPPAAPDSSPSLGPGQEAESPVPRVAVPAAYERVVRRIFARHGPEEESP